MEVEIVLPGVQRVTLSTSQQFNGDWSSVMSGVSGLRGTGASGKALVQFVQPNDLYVLDLATGSKALLASETNASGLFGVQPSLGIKEYSGIAVFNHADYGYTYFLGTGSSALSGFYGGADIDDDDLRLHLFDANRDGILDSALPLSTNQARAAGYLDLDNYIDWWLE